MPDDFFGNMMELGAERGGWKSWWAIFGLLIGAGVGGYLGYVGDGLLAALGGVGIGGFFGWVGAVLLTGLLRFLVIFAIIGTGVLGWMWLTGGLG